MSSLFTPYKLGPVTLRNRTIRSAAFESMGRHFGPTQQLKDYHVSVARGGVGMTTLAYAAVCRSGLSFNKQLWLRPEIVPGLREITDAVHREGAAAAIQIGHCGNMTHWTTAGQMPIGASTGFNLYAYTPVRGMKRREIEQVARDFGTAVRTARDAGFDSVEVHAGHGYLISQFLSPYTNHRHDEYGGSLENRMRFMRMCLGEAVEAARACGMAITVKHNMYDGFKGGIEIPESIEIESIANALPIVRKEIAATKKKKAVERSSIDQRIDYRWVDLRTDENQLMFKAQSCFVNAMRKFLLDRNFIEIHTPKLIAAASESGSEVFKVDYFDRNAYLAQSPQFYKQMAMAAGFERIFETGPVFRAEKSYTNKHSTEFSGFDLEFSYITSYKDVMAMEEQLLKAGLQAVKDAYGDQIQELFGKEVIVPETPFPVVKLADLYKGLEEDFGYVVDDSEKGDLTTEAERLSYDWVKKHYNHEFLFVTDYDAEKRAFYHMRDENGVPQGYDLIWRGVEITTGAQREHRYEVLKKQAEEKGLADDVKFYLEFFQYGCPPHGGFGLGIDRLTMLLCGLTIKDAEFLFRGPNRLTP